MAEAGATSSALRHRRPGARDVPKPPSISPLQTSSPLTALDGHQTFAEGKMRHMSMDSVMWSGFETLYLGGVVCITVLCILLKQAFPEDTCYDGIPRMSAIESVSVRIPYWFAFGATFAAAIGCIAKALSTASPRKVALGTRLGVHIGITSFCMLCCALDLVWTPVGEQGHHVNIVAQCVWFLTSASMALLFHKMAYYSVGMGGVNDDTRGPLFISFAAFMREGVTVLARLFPRPSTLPWLSGVVIIFAIVSLIIKARVMAPYFESTAGAMDRRIMLVSLFAIVAAMVATDVVFLAYAAGYVECTTSEAVLCVCITVRALLLYVRCTIVMLYDDERAVAAALVAQDRLAMQQQHEEQRRQLYRVIFHELRVPLNSIVLGLDLANATTPNPATGNASGRLLTNHVPMPTFDLSEAPSGMSEMQDTNYMMREAAGNMMTILSDLLDIAKIEARAFVLKVSPLSVASLLRSVTRDMTPLARAKRVEISWSVDMDVPPVLVGDGPRLSQILANFLSNAIKFTPHDGTGRVMLRASRASSVTDDDDDHISVELACVDNGEGINPEDRRHLFQLFSQLDNAGALNIRGSGLGLAICAQIAEMHGGSVGCHSEVGCGSKFFVIIPFARTTTSVDALCSSSEDSVGSGGSSSSGSNGSNPSSEHVSDLERTRRVSSSPVRTLDYRSLQIPQYGTSNSHSGTSAAHAPSRHRGSASASAAVASSSGDSATSTDCCTSAGEENAMSPGAPVPPFPSPASGTSQVPLRGAGATATPTPSPASATAAGSDSTAASFSTATATPTTLVTGGGSGSVAALSEAVPTSPLVTDTGECPTAASLRVMVVDDDASNRLLLSRSLRKHLPEGTVVDLACDGLQAVTATAATSYDVICLDNRMPVMDGTEAVQRMRANGVKSLIIGCTANTLQVDQQAFIAAGADCVCVKPVRISDVITHIRERIMF